MFVIILFLEVHGLWCDVCSFTALHHGALLEKADVCRELLEVDAAVDLRDKNGEISSSVLMGLVNRESNSLLMFLFPPCFRYDSVAFSCLGW